MCGCVLAERRTASDTWGSWTYTGGSFAEGSHLEETLGTHAPGMHHALRDLLSIELAELFKQVVILQQHRTCPQDRQTPSAHAQAQPRLWQNETPGAIQTRTQEVLLHTSLPSSERKLVADDWSSSVRGQLLRVELHGWHARNVLVLAAALQGNWSCSAQKALLNTGKALMLCNAGGRTGPQPHHLW